MLTSNTDSQYNSLDDCLDAANMQSEDLFSVASLVRDHPKPKKQKTKDFRPLIYVQFNPRLGKAKPVTLKCLLDTGASASIIAAKHASKLRTKNIPGGTTVWTTPAGELTTSKKCQCQFILPEFHRD